MSSVLVVLAHPNLAESVANRAMLQALSSMEQVTVHDLYATAPDGKFDIPAEQARMETHQAIVLQHPMYWYSSPSLLKEWLDQILQPGWAYFGDNKLKGKQLRSAITAGAPESAYGEGGWNPYPVDDYLKVFESTGHFCGMEWGDPFVMYEVSELSESQMASEVERYQAWTAALVG